MVRRGRVVHVFDASALIALLKDEPGAAETEALLADASSARLVHAVNLCEVYYHFMKLNLEYTFAAELVAIETGGLVPRQDLDRPFWRSVARLKALFQRASLGDCFAMALAQRVKGTIVTADHPAFSRAAVSGICQVTFIR
jgi:PIN domain nuclease of toxin-antitoxin system